jgi:GNAT superfamily N-acetyltransferase/predicted nucleotidyltransferase
VRHSAFMHLPGLNEDGFIAREGDLARVPEAFEPVVAAVKAEITAAYPTDRLHSAYLYGSVPRGTAVPGTSDLDVLLALLEEPTDADRATASRLEETLDARFPQINGAGILLASTATLLSDLERHDLGWFVACLCTPLIGEDLGARLPRYRPTSLLARETNGDLGDIIPRWQGRLDEARTDADLYSLSRHAARRIVRTGFTLVMPRWGGWTSDLGESAAVFGRYYPARADQMRTAAAAGLTPTADRSVLGMLVNDLGPWLAAEYVSVHGRKTPREAAAATISIRPARAEDVPALVSLRIANAERHVALDPAGHRLPDRDAVQRHFEKLLSGLATTDILVAEVSGTVVGMTEVVIMSMPPDHQILVPRRVAEVHTVVLASHRGQGVGKALVAAAEQHAARRGVSRLFAPILAPNAEALGFYGRAGFGPHGVILSKELQADGSGAASGAV